MYTISPFHLTPCGDLRVGAVLCLLFYLCFVMNKGFYLSLTERKVYYDEGVLNVD